MPRSSRLPVEPGFVDPSCYDVDRNGCYIWKHAMLGVTPIVTREYRHVNVRRLLVPGIAPDERIHMDCEVDRCVNRAHFFIYQTNRVYTTGYRAETGENIVQIDGSINPNCYIQLPNGCRVWTRAGAGGTGSRLQITDKGRVTDVRRYLLPGVPKHAQIKLTCGTPDCINPAHFTLETKQERAQRRRAENKALRRAKSLAADPWQRRPVAYVRDEIKELMEGASGESFNQKAWTAAWAFANGASIIPIAQALNISTQGAYQLIQTVDVKLRIQRAGLDLLPIDP